MAEITEKELQDYKKLRESRDKQYERQNKHIKENYYKHSTTFPIGTKERIEAVTSEKLNTFICRVILAEVERLESLKNTKFVQEKQISQQIEPKQAEKLQEVTSELDNVSEPETPKAEFKPMTPEEVEELEALIKNQLDKQKAHGEKLEQDKQKRLEAERAEKEAEIMRYAEKLRASKQDIVDAQIAKKVRVILEDAELREIVLDPEKKEYVIEQLGEDVYNAVVQVDKEKQRQESVDRATVDMGQAAKPPF